jgi:hypothetical protein
MEPYQRASMIYGLAEGLSMELSTADDPFLEARVHTVLLAQLLGLPESQAPIIAGVIERYIDANRRALSRLHEALAIDRYALLIDSMSDLYELPIRISDILGQCALLFFAQPVLSEDDSKLIFGVVTKILDQYGNSILALTDEQATGYLLFLEMCRNASWLEQIEEVIGRLYHDLHKNFARCADYSLNAESRFAVLAERYQHSFALTENLYNFPSDLTTVILTFAALGSFDDVVDYTLIDIDHTLALGRDFWRCIDLRRLLRGDILPKFHSSTSHLFREEGVCSLAAALALRDRLPWHAVEIRTRLDRTRDTPGGKS